MEYFLVRYVQYKYQLLNGFRHNMIFLHELKKSPAYDIILPLKKSVKTTSVEQEGTALLGKNIALFEMWK